MLETDDDGRRLFEAARDLVWRGELDAAIRLFDRALAATPSEELREELIVAKAEALLSAHREGKELDELPRIVVRHRTPRIVYRAAGTLMRRWLDADPRKAIFYGEIARKAAREVGEPLAEASLLNNLGVVMTATSRFDEATAAFDEALVRLLRLPMDAAAARLRWIIVANLGGVKVASDDYESGVSLLLSSIPHLEADYDRVEALLDLTLAYLQTERYDEAERVGSSAFALATDRRQVRNANYVLGELRRRQRRWAEAGAYFDVVASFFRDRDNVRRLLLNVDLTAVVNWKGC